MRVDHHDVVIVGSGFGGSVAAYRLAEAKLDVCLLERGKPYPPGSFPRTPFQMSRAFWDPSEGLHGLYDVWTFRGIEAIVSSGLGGGSLIYANVLIRKDEDWFVREDRTQGVYEYWPITRAELDPYYDKVRDILEPQRYPFDKDPYAQTSKTAAMQRASRAAGVEWNLPKLAVTFRSPGSTEPVPGEPINDKNLHKAMRFSCRLVGECDVGCNFGSKNSLDYTYLSKAVEQGAEIRTRCEVIALSPLSSGGFEVVYVEHIPENEGRPTDTSQLPQRIVTADRVILAAGAFGSPYLLFRNRTNFPGLSDQLGSRFSGNGDLLGFIVDVRSAADNEHKEILEPSIGPVITSTVRVDPPGGRGYYIQDGGYPNYVSWLSAAGSAPNTLLRSAAFAARLVKNRLSRHPWSNVSRDMSFLLERGGSSSATILPVLGMGRDIPDGQMSINAKGYLEIDWTIRTSKAYFKSVVGTMRELATELGGRFRRNPTWYFRRVVTVHPLGGCPMGRDDREGVIDAYGQVFNFPGLYVMDGSAMPGPVGPNPSFTIAAFAERCCRNIIDSASPRSDV
jgi:cholesterol oxidase